jgi:hypothetical protein
MSLKIKATYSYSSSLEVVITCDFDHSYYDVNDSLLATAVKIFAEDRKVAQASAITMGHKESASGRVDTDTTTITIVADGHATLDDIGYGASDFEDAAHEWLKKSD